MEKDTVRVLLVDDDEDDYVLTRDWFSQMQGAKFQLEWVADYDAGMKAIAHNQHDVYLLDYRLGDRNGLELLQQAIAFGCSAPIILLTGQGDQEIDIEAMKAGAADYLEKTQLGAALLERSIRYAIERKRAEQQIREQAALLDIATDAIFVRDLENKIRFWNQGAERLYGWTDQEAIGKSATELLCPEAVAQIKELMQILFERGSWQGELHQVTKSGKQIIVESRWTLVRDRLKGQSLRHRTDQPKSILIVNTDITQKKQLEAQFLRAQRMESIGTLASGIAHDLNNLLAPIMMTAQLLESQIHDERSKRLLPILVTNAKRGANLVRQVLSFSRGLEGDRTVVQVKHLILEIVHIAKETFPKFIEIYTDLPQYLWTVSGDATQLHQVLMNFCVNARDAMPDGGTLTISAEDLFIDENYALMNLEAKVGSYIVITIADTGTGISPEVVDRIFEPFFTTKELGKGTGLGLSTALGIIKSHGGFVDVHSQVGKGTQFKLYFPAVEEQEIQEQKEVEIPIGNGELILVVDDEAAICETTKTTLETYNYNVLTANDGIEAVVLYAKRHEEISLVLMDLMMPFMDGPTAIRTLQKINPKVKIIAVSGLTASDKFTAVASTGINTFLSKPYTAKELLQNINEVLKSNRDSNLSNINSPFVQLP